MFEVTVRDSSGKPLADADVTTTLFMAGDANDEHASDAKPRRSLRPRGGHLSGNRTGRDGGRWDCDGEREQRWTADSEQGNSHSSRSEEGDHGVGAGLQEK